MFKLIFVSGLLTVTILSPVPQAADMQFSLTPNHDTIISREDQEAQRYDLTAKNNGDQSTGQLANLLPTYRLL